MAKKSLSQLRKERDSLLKGNKALMLKKTELLEREKLRAEIRALKNPGVKSFKKELGVIGRKAGKFIKRRSDIISENLARIEQEEKRKKRRKK